MNVGSAGALVFAIAIAVSLQDELPDENAIMYLQPRPPGGDEACFPFEFGDNLASLDTDTNIYRQGAVVKLIPVVSDGITRDVDVPMRCVSDWSVIGPARLSADSTTLTIDEDAPPGSTLEVRFRFAEQTARTVFRVVAKHNIVLTGRWSQKTMTGCQSSGLVGELELTPASENPFTPDERIINLFSVRLLPFHHSHDYWGTYTFDSATGDIRFHLDGGLRVPRGLDLKGGKAELSNGRLTLTGVYLGAWKGPPQKNCTYTFGIAQMSRYRGFEIQSFVPPQ